MNNTYGPYSPVKQAGQFYYISGQVGVDNETKRAEADIAAQAHQVFKNLQALLGNAGLQLNDIAKTTVYLKNMDDFTAMNEIYVTYFNEPRPARACVAVASLPRIAGEVELLIEVDAVAFKEARK